MSEKQIGMELQKTVKALEKAKENAIEQMGEAIGLAADAGDILLSARTRGARPRHHPRGSRNKR
jgi:hypothetical protein